MSGVPDRRRIKRSNRSQSSDQPPSSPQPRRPPLDPKDGRWMAWISSMTGADPSVPPSHHQQGNKQGPKRRIPSRSQICIEEDEETQNPVPGSERQWARKKDKGIPDVESTEIFTDVHDDMTDDSVKESKPKSVTTRDATNVRRCFYPIVRSYTRELIVAPQCKYKTISFHKHQHVFETDTQKQITHKRAMRSRADPWRRYGAQQAIHRLGGHVITSNVKKNRKTKYVIPGTPMPPPPKLKPITTLKELYARPLIGATRKPSFPEEKGTDNTHAPDLDDPGDCCSSPPPSSPQSERER
ncbi:unnamed protein product [Bursaphelenchus xylophilus]|uniref:(pine wood nematode) hypothetical protein n=1 Tax=Bursaphelenchus xylophilus TaxID=6326 RepID=A0A1I7SSJ5_BURXY|nr:unnamed protein product [Bursaphelenchus xylophilus]CAG9097480.1 unnamed protein product [Bursaphelenchus xylophilus]